MREKISFILGCAARNGQILSENSINSINKTIDDARIDVSYALGYHIEKEGTKFLSSSLITCSRETAS